MFHDMKQHIRIDYRSLCKKKKDGLSKKYREICLSIIFEENLFLVIFFTGIVFKFAPSLLNHFHLIFGKMSFAKILQNL